jgi:hypothetical protein
MADLKIDPVTNDLVISKDGDLVLVTKGEAVAQSVKIALLTHYGESVYARNLGTPWVTAIFIANSEFYQDTVETILKTIVERVPGVDGVTDFFFSIFDPEEAYAKISMTIKVNNEEIDFTLEINSP